MQHAAYHYRSSLLPTRARLIAAARLATGLVQGLVLYLLYLSVEGRSWPATSHLLFAPLLIVALFAPVVLVSALGHLRRRQILMWLGVVVVVLAALSVHDAWRRPLEENFQLGATHWEPHYPWPLFIAFGLAMLYIAHTFVLAAASDGQRIARYSTYFETAWKLLIQMAFSLLFVGVLWAVLHVGAALFDLVKLDFLKQIVRKEWFAIPVTAFAFSCAVHITDVRPAIVRGIRSLLLVMLAWLLPLATLIVVGFLLALPWTGLQPLWDTRSATAVLLVSSAVLIVLVNAAYQDGEVANRLAAVVRISARIAALALLPLVGIAVYALALRVGDYGWTNDRIIAAACLLVATCYALGYAWAALARGPWLAPLERVNVAAALLTLGVLLVLFSPLGDPARISVQNQMQRLAAGKVSAAEFDYNYLRFDGQRYGLDALQRLTKAEGPQAQVLREKAALALKKKYRWEPANDLLTGEERTNNIKPWPAGTTLPASLAAQAEWDEREGGPVPTCLLHKGAICDAYLIDFDGVGEQEVLLVPRERGGRSAVLAMGADGRWKPVARLPDGAAGCASLRKRLQAGESRPLPSLRRDLQIGDQRIELLPWGGVDDFVCADPAPQGAGTHSSD